MLKYSNDMLHVDINPFMLNGFSCLISLNRSISYIKHFWLDFIITIFCRILYIINANNVDPDQMLHSATSDLGLHNLPMVLLWNARLKWVNNDWLLIIYIGYMYLDTCKVHIYRCQSYTYISAEIMEKLPSPLNPYMPA